MDVVYQCTSVGLAAGDPPAIPRICLRGCRNLMDMIYHDTPVLQQARELGCRTTDGRGMLLYQGVRSLSLWTGSDAPVEAMRRALSAALAAKTAD
jgi:shikimate dehydrogenase